MSDESPIIFTDSCCTKVADLIAEENNPDLKLRVFVNGGGCSGFQYGFTFDEIKNDDDFEIQKTAWRSWSTRWATNIWLVRKSTTPKACKVLNSSSAIRMPKRLAVAARPSPYKQSVSSRKTGRLYLQTAFCVNLF